MEPLQPIPPQNQNGGQVLWKKVFSIQNIPEKVQKLKKKAKWLWLGGVGGGIVIFVIAILLLLPIIGKSDNQWFGVYLTGISGGIAIPITTALYLNELHNMQRDFKILTNWYSRDELATYEESLTITDRAISLKVAKNATRIDSILRKNLAEVNKDSWSFDVNDLQLIQFWKVFKQYYLVFSTQRSMASRAEKSVDLIEYYRNGIPGVRYDLSQLISPNYFSKEDVNQVLHVLTSLVPHVRVKAGL